MKTFVALIALSFFTSCAYPADLYVLTWNGGEEEWSYDDGKISVSREYFIAFSRPLDKDEVDHLFEELWAMPIRPGFKRVGVGVALGPQPNTKYVYSHEKLIRDK